MTNDTVLGNFIGLNAAGTAGVPNTSAGIYVVAGASGNTILNNVISSNYIGVLISDPGTRGNFIQANLIGTDMTGQTAVANTYEGLAVQNGATANTIGGTVAGAANLISGNYYNLVIYDPGTSGNVIQGNLIGTDITGNTALPGPFEYEGLAMGNGAASNTIGGTVVGAANLISGNYYNLVIRDPGTSGNVIEGNLIGVDITGKTALPGPFEYEGLAIGNGAASNTIGGTVAGAANIISGNYLGVVLSDTNTSDNLLQGNLIGTDITGTNAIGNGFVNVQLQNGASGNVIGGIAAGAGNTIAFSGTGPGVVLYDPGTTKNAIRGNSIFSSGALGIDLNNDGVTPNHTGFLAGPNDLQNFPVITNAFGYARGTIILGQFNSLANGLYFIDVYRNVVTNRSGYGEGKFYVGSVSVTTDGSGNAAFALTNSAANYTGQYFAATATSAGGDTSEFGADVVATNQPVPSALFSGPFLAGTNGFSFALTLQSNFSYRIQATTNLGTNPVPWIDLTNFIAHHSLAHLHRPHRNQLPHPVLPRHLSMKPVNRRRNANRDMKLWSSLFDWVCAPGSKSRRRGRGRVQGCGCVRRASSKTPQGFQRAAPGKRVSERHPEDPARGFRSPLLRRGGERAPRHSDALCAPELGKDASPPRPIYFGRSQGRGGTRPYHARRPVPGHGDGEGSLSSLRPRCRNRVPVTARSFLLGFSIPYSTRSQLSNVHWVCCWRAVLFDQVAKWG